VDHVIPSFLCSHAKVPKQRSFSSFSQFPSVYEEKLDSSFESSQVPSSPLWIYWYMLSFITHRLLKPFPHFAAICTCKSSVSWIVLGRLLWVASCGPNVRSQWSSRMATWFHQAALWMSTLTVLWGMFFCGRWVLLYFY